MANTSLRFRQVHLDFHTSEHLVNIGGNFDPDEFADMLVKAHVDSITCFARCHHGWIYYDSKLNPERVHPHLQRDLLREQIEACHARGIKVPIYTTVHWDYFTASRHPEWLILEEDGMIRGTKPYEAGFYQWLALNSPYVDFLKAHVQEILETLPVDGLFLDIVHPQDDSSIWTRSAMLEAGLDPSNGDVRREYGIQVVNDFRQEMTAFIRQFSDDCTIFYNQGHVGPQHREVADTFTHWELESLPSGGWGYLHFPLSMRYARTLGQECLGMTGKFHTSWGDFHSFKNQAALEYECFRMLAQGAKCSIGDQLSPDGRIDPHVYELIGSVYAEVEHKQPWCENAVPVVEIGVFTPEEFSSPLMRNIPGALMGATRMLEELGQQFDIIDSQSDLSPYRLLILPDDICVNQQFAQKLDAYLESGGAIIASFESGMNADKDAFAWNAVGISLIDEGPRDSENQLVRGRYYPRHDFVEYVLPQGDIGRGLAPTEHAMYLRGMSVSANDGTETLVSVIPAHFDRRFQHFHSHKQAPSTGRPGTPAITKRESVIYFSHPVFSQYQQIAPIWSKKLVQNALALLMPDSVIQHNAPSTLLTTVMEQKTQNRWVVHLLHYIPERRGEAFDIIEDVIPLYNIELTLKTPSEVAGIRIVPQGETLDFQNDTGTLRFTLPELNGHQMIEVQFA